MNGPESKGGGTRALEVLEGMQAMEQALARSPGPSRQEVLSSLREWQDAVAAVTRETPMENAEIATLYEISQALNSSLNLTKTLNVVMEMLIRLTGAERGCLMLLNDGGKLEIRAAQRFDRKSTDSRDLTLSHTVVSEAIENREPVLTTNAQIDPRFSGQESVIGYHLRSIACVPLQLRGKVIGALYLDNHLRAGVFSKDDLSAVSSFANQAAVAIENARLHTLTDQALAARVEGLTTLQKIDRELNASLDFQRVLDLTLN